MRKILVFTGSRAEYGLLRPLMEEIKKDSSLTLQILVTGAHLSERFGFTLREVESDGFAIDETVDMKLNSDSPQGVTASMGRGMIGFGEAFQRLEPDMMVLLGDRFETFCAAACALVYRIPVAHIHGGELTLGAMDDAFRHAITKMSHLHFTSTEIYRRRVIQMGEAPEKVFHVGAMGVERLLKIKPLSREALSRSLGFLLDSPFFLVTFHPVTLARQTAGDQVDELLRALDRFPGHQVIFTKANADTEGGIINQRIDAYVRKKGTRAFLSASLGEMNYLSAMRHAAAVIGNSSSGIIEAPSFQTPTVNIGDRQEGRLKPDSVIDCEPVEEKIGQAISQAMSGEFKERVTRTKNLYEKEKTAETIKEIIKNASLNEMVKKRFFDCPINA